MTAALLWFASSIGSTALRAAPFAVSRAGAVGVREAPSISLSLLAARELRDLIGDALVKTIPVDLD